jgi:hypothetical protein
LFVFNISTISPKHEAGEEKEEIWKQQKTNN